MDVLHKAKIIPLVAHGMFPELILPYALSALIFFALLIGDSFPPDCNQSLVNSFFNQAHRVE